MEKIQKASKEFKETDEVDFITEFLSNPEPENDSSLKKSFFNKMLTENLFDSFINWLFENIKNLTLSQLMCIFFVFISASTHGIRILLIFELKNAYLSKT